MRAFATLCIAAGLSLALHAAPARAQEAPLPPVDAGAKDASWVQFHKRLLAAVEQRDVKFLLSILDPKVRNSFEKPDGVKAFVEQWDLDTPAKAKESPLWTEMRSMLRFGAAPVEAAPARPTDEAVAAPHSPEPGPARTAPRPVRADSVLQRGGQYPAARR